jgi:2-polyprenyl-6-methoxyphenol hydroxylase-like FAD-dependent oxidoreductase
MTPNTALRPCKVIIAGAGVAGLTLALALEKTGIDYVLLEGYPEIVAQAGAGICLLPNGLRILDQLGCYEDLRDQVKGVLDTVSVRDPSGEALHISNGWSQRMVERYVLLPMLFFRLF